MTIMKTLHTIYTNFAKRVFFLLFTLIIGGGSVLGAKWTWTASNVNELGSNTSNAITLNGKEWITNRSSGTNQGQLQSGCIQIGANGAAQTITLRSSAFIGKILSVAVECASYQSYHSVSISVGGTSYLSATPTPKWTTVDIKKGTGESSGEIQISFSKNNNSARALYLKSITIEYDESFVEDDEPVYSCGWIATDINNISSTDLVVITMTNSSGTYAMSNDKGTSAAPSAKQVTVLDNILDCDIDDNIKWNVSNNNGTLTIYPNGTTDKWLYCTNTNNGVKVGTGDAKQFTLKSGYLYEDGTTDARYIGVYNSQDWRCYTSINSNIEDQTLKFYKYVPCGPTETTITLHPNGGTPNEEQEITTEEESYTLPECPFSRTGYTFDGWATSANGSVIYENEKTIENLNGTAVNLYAKWTPIQYDITYNLNGGTNHASNPANYTIETSTITLQAPTKTGYTFGGWYKENTFENKVTQITNGSIGNITLYAQWAPNTYTVRFDANEGTEGTMDEQTFTYDVAQDLSENTYARTGYNFTGWNTADDGNGTSYADKAEVKNLTFEANGVVTLYAQWTAKDLINYRTLCTYNIEYTNLESTTHSNPVTYTAADLPLEFTAPSAREGYTFAGWNPASLDENTRGDQEVEAQWAANTYSVIFNANGGTGTMEKQPFTYDVEQALSANQFTRVGYTFAGWNDNASGNSTSYTDQQVVKNLSSAKNGQRTLYAQWTANTNTPYVVKHYKEQLDGTYPTEADDTDNLTGTTATSVTPEVKSYEGFTAPSTQTVSIAADGSTVVTYQYTRNSYNLSWNVNEGDALTGEYTSGIVKYEAAITQPNTPTRTGYTFIGWSPAEIPATMPANNLEFIAQWAAIHTITWMVNGSQAEGDPTTSVVNGQTITTLPTTPDVDCNGKVFVGWTTAEIVGETATILVPLYTKLSDFPVVTSNMNFYAVFANGSGDERWVETEIGEIQSGDEVVITMCKGAFIWTISNAKNTSTAPTANDITANIQGKYLTTVIDEYKWVIKKDNANLTFYSYSDNANYLYCTNADNGVRVGGTGDAKVFVVDGNYLKNTQTTLPRYLGVSLNTNPHSWRCYTETTGVIQDQTLKFYKKTTVYTSYTNYSTSCVAGEFDITNTDPIYVTSAVGQKIKATDKLVLTTTDMAVGTEISLSAPNITFYKEGVEITQLTTTAASETFELEIAYQPTISKTTEQPTITLEILGYQFTFNNKISCRSLPETFAIVAKVGNVWYALPSQGLNSTTPPAAYPVEVDDIADPKAVTAVPTNADWSLRQVYASSGSNDRFADNGEKLVFVNDANPQKALNAGSTGNYLLTDARYDGYNTTTTPGLYEWTPTTTDLKTYTLTNAQRTDRTLNVATNTVFGVHSDNKATTEVRFLPIQNRYTPAALQVVEWKENSVVIMYNGDPAQTASVSVNGGSAQTTTLSSAQKDIAVYELTANGLATNPRQMLKLVIGSEQLLLPIPYIIGSATDDATILGSVAAKKEIAKVADLVVLNGGKLTANGAASGPFKFRNVTIYGGGKLVIPSDKGFGVASLTLRVGGVEDGEYVYTYPQLDLNGTINSGNINLDLMTTYDYYYPFSVPYEVTLTDIHYPVEIYGSNVKPTNKGSFLVSYYDGEARSQGNTGWKDVEEQGQTVLSPHVGYSIWGLPKKVSVNGATSVRQTYGIHRIPMKKAAGDVMDNETKDQNVSISAYNAARDNDKGWNFIGNPYLVQHGGLDGSDADVYMGLLVKEMKNGQWTGGWVFNGEQVRYVTQTNDCLNYTSTPVAGATIPAFSAFFIQAKETGAIAFTSPNVAAAQSLTARRSDENKEITTGIILSGEKHSDRTGLLIADQFTEAYEFNADLSKFDNQDMNLYTISSSGKLAFMAINEDLAKQTIPLGYSVSIDGMYTIAFDEQRYSRNDIYALYLIDYDRNETTNLLHMDYDFYSDSGASAERFALQVAFAPNTSTDVEYTQVGDVLLSREGNTLRLDNLPSDATVTVYDAVGHLIEQHTASQLLQLTLQKGYYLLHIGNNQNSVVIDTFIP